MTPEQREAKRVYDAAWRKEHPEYSAAYRADHSEEARACRAARYEAHIERLRMFRTVNGCEDCGTHEGRLEHHHTDPSTKRRNVSDMHSYSLGALEDELEKCVVLCCSCHQKRHVQMRAA